MARRIAETATKSERGVKSNLIREHLNSHSELKNPAIAELITRRGVPCKAQDVANMRTKLKKAGLAGGRIPALTADDLMKVKELAGQAGGIRGLEKNISEVEALASQVGGIERLKKGLQALSTIMEK